MTSMKQAESGQEKKRTCNLYILNIVGSTWDSGTFLVCSSGTSNIAPPWYRIVLPDFVMPVLNFDSFQVNIPNTPLTCRLPYNVLLT